MCVCLRVLSCVHACLTLAIYMYSEDITVVLCHANIRWSTQKILKNEDTPNPFFGDFGECLMCFGKLVLLNLDDTGNADGNLAVGVLHRLRL